MIVLIMRLLLVFFFGLLIPVISFADGEKCDYRFRKCPKGTMCIIKESSQPWLGGSGTCEKEKAKPTEQCKKINFWGICIQTIPIKPATQQITRGSQQYVLPQPASVTPCIPEKKTQTQAECATWAGTDGKIRPISKRHDTPSGTYYTCEEE